MKLQASKQPDGSVSLALTGSAVCTCKIPDYIAALAEHQYPEIHKMFQSLPRCSSCDRWHEPPRRQVCVLIDDKPTSLSHSRFEGSWQYFYVMHNDQPIAEISVPRGVFDIENFTAFRTGGSRFAPVQPNFGAASHECDDPTMY